MNFPAFTKLFLAVTFVVAIYIEDVNSIADDRGSHPLTKGPTCRCPVPCPCQKNKTKIEPIVSNPCPTTTSTAPVLVGSNPCTRGPSFWCASLENAKKCGLKASDCDKYDGAPYVQFFQSPYQTSV